MTDEPSRGVRLSDKQIVFGVMTATVVAVVVFLCGVFVGRGVHALRPASPDGGTVDSRVLPDTTVSLAEAEAGSTASGDAGGAITAPPEKLTYYDRLGKAEPTNESLAGLTESGPPVPPPDAPEGGTPDKPSPTGAPLRPASVAAPAASGGGAASADADGTTPYTVQVSAVRRKAEAQTIVDRLKKKGFPAYVFVPPPGDPRGGFRVRVGSFKSRQEATGMASRLQKEGYSPWIIR